MGKECLKSRQGSDPRVGFISFSSISSFAFFYAFFSSSFGYPLVFDCRSLSLGFDFFDSQFLSDWLQFIFFSSAPV